MVLGWMMGTDPLVLEFQASVNKPFINFPALWRVSAHMVLDFCSPSWEMFVHCPSHCLLIDNFTVDRLSAFQRLCNPFPSPACPYLHLLLTLCILLLPRVFFIPTEANTSWQKRPPVAHVHL